MENIAQVYQIEEVYEHNELSEARSSAHQLLEVCLIIDYCAEITSHIRIQWEFIES